VDNLETAKLGGDSIRALREEVERLKNLILATNSSLGGGLLEPNAIETQRTRNPAWPETFTQERLPPRPKK
jgi:hypothetical protein